LARNVLAHALRRRGQLEVELEAPPVRRVDLADGVRDPERGNRIELERLVDPGLAVDRPGATLVAAEQPRQLLGDRREHVLDLVEADRGARAALEDRLRDLERTVALPARQAVAVGVEAVHLVELEPRQAADQLGELGLARSGRTVE